SVRPCSGSPLRRSKSAASRAASASTSSPSREAGRSPPPPSRVPPPLPGDLSFTVPPRPLPPLAARPLALPFVAAPAALLENPPAYEVKAHYQKSTYMVPMRDGVKLHATVYAPREAREKLPFLLLRTPYGTGPYGADEYRTSLGPSRHSFEFEEDGFIFVFQDVRGKFKSEGEFTVMRPHRPGKKGKETDESSDTYDTIDWLLKNVPNNNGRVGTIGTSYPGFQVIHSMIEAHPALRAASPQASPIDM